MKYNLFTDCTMCELGITNEIDVWLIYWGTLFFVFSLLWCAVNLDFSVIRKTRITATTWFKNKCKL